MKSKPVQRMPQTEQVHVNDNDRNWFTMKTGGRSKTSIYKDHCGDTTLICIKYECAC